MPKKTRSTKSAKSSKKRSTKKQSVRKSKYEDYTIPELVDRFKARGLHGHSQMTKDQMIKALRGQKVTLSKKKRCPKGTRRTPFHPRRCVTPEKLSKMKCPTGKVRNSLTGRCRKRPLSDYQRYFKKRSKEIKNKNPGLAQTEVMSQVGAEWSYMKEQNGERVSSKKISSKSSVDRDEEAEESAALSEHISSRMSGPRRKLAVAPAVMPRISTPPRKSSGIPQPSPPRKSSGIPQPPDLPERKRMLENLGKMSEARREKDMERRRDAQEAIEDSKKMMFSMNRGPWYWGQTKTVHFNEVADLLKEGWDFESPEYRNNYNRVKARLNY